MRDDDSSLTTSPDPNRPTLAPARTLRWLWPLALGVFVPLTSLAVASVSLWLVLPYLFLIGGILFAPAKTSTGSRGASRDHRDHNAVGESLQAARASGFQQASAGGFEDEAAAEAAAVATAEATPKSKRTRGRSRAKGKSTDPLEAPRATWVRIGPGKFVRVEAPAERAEGAEDGTSGVAGLQPPHWTDEPAAAGPIDQEVGEGQQEPSSQEIEARTQDERAIEPDRQESVREGEAPTEPTTEARPELHPPAPLIDETSCEGEAPAEPATEAGPELHPPASLVVSAQDGSVRAGDFPAPAAEPPASVDAALFGMQTILTYRDHCASSTDEIA
ncbi:MAG TPA: hypothetical protein VGZ22_08370, partial [Isosphaeraceae bacterium]|nr:hypothetical protein [Isosphaeraceae bacterium]